MLMDFFDGRVAERSNATVLKTVWPERVTWVRIPPLPQIVAVTIKQVKRRGIMLHCPRPRSHQRSRHKKTAEHLQKHAQKRALTRYQIDLTQEEISRINNQITSERAFRLQKYSTNRSLWQIILPNGKPAFVVYDKKRSSIVTFLTEQMVIPQTKNISQ